MAEIAAGAVVAEQIVSTGLEAGAAVSIARPTQPLKALLSQTATTLSGDSSLALARAHHTVTVLADKAYLFGGSMSDGKLCNTDVHVIPLPSASNPAAEYACYPAFPVKEASTGEVLVPAPRKGHAACARDKYVVIHGGSDENGSPIDEDACLWLWDSETLRWSKVRAAVQIGKSLAPRYGHGIFMVANQDFLVIHGGTTAEGPSAETWFYDFDAVAWTQLQSSCGVPSSSALVGDTLYSISTDSALGGSVNFLKLGRNATERSKPDALAWDKVDFPANPLVPGPKPREGAALVPISTGFGRNYLVYILGSNHGQGIENKQQPLLSDIWALQLPSHGFSGASVKDAIRDKLPGGVESGVFSWGEIEIIPTEQVEHEGKVHPGPRAYFGADSCLGGNGIIFWGGSNAKGENESDGWLLKIK